jgi:hypothetical protein
VSGEHADEQVRFDAAGEVMADGPQVEVIDLDGLEVPFDVLEVLVDPHDPWRVCAFGDSGGADHVDSVEAGLGGDVVLVPAERESAVADLADEVLAGFMLADDFPGRYPDLVLVCETPGGY